MTRMRRVVATLAISVPALALAGCGGELPGMADPSTVPESTAPSPVQALRAAAATPKDLVLASSDIGGGWTVVPSETKALSVDEAVKDDSAALRKIERPAYRSGYQVVYVNAQGDGAASQAYRYANPAVARRIYRLGLRDVARKNPAYKPMKAPPGAPQGVSMFRGTDKTPHGSTVPLYIALWVRGRDIGCVLVLGKGTSPKLLVDLARKQDQRMAAAAAASG
jgi:hypothetical protein